MKFVVKLPGGENQLVEVSPAATAAAIRAAAGFGGQGHGLVMNSSPVADSAPASSFPELSTFSVVALASAAAPTATEAAAECTICLEPLGNNAPNAPVQALQCGHFFHAVCIREWCHHSSYCPLCRRVISLGATPAPAPKVGPPRCVVVIRAEVRPTALFSHAFAPSFSAPRTLLSSSPRRVRRWSARPSGASWFLQCRASTRGARGTSLPVTTSRHAFSLIHCHVVFSA